MRLLIDTHVFIWALAAPELLSPRARALLVDPDNEIVASAVTAYEVELKRDRDPLIARISDDLAHVARTIGFRWLPISADHASKAGRLPLHHRDPWDRILAAQSLAEGMPLISIDDKIATFGAEVLW